MDKNGKMEIRKNTERKKERNVDEKRKKKRASKEEINLKSMKINQSIQTRMKEERKLMLKRKLDEKER